MFEFFGQNSPRRRTHHSTCSGEVSQLENRMLLSGHSLLHNAKSAQQVNYSLAGNWNWTNQNNSNGFFNISVFNDKLQGAYSYPSIYYLEGFVKSTGDTVKFTGHPGSGMVKKIKLTTTLTDPTHMEGTVKLIYQKPFKDNNGTDTIFAVKS